MNDEHLNPEEQETATLSSFQAPQPSSSRGSMLIGGILVALVAVGVGFQLVQATSRPDDAVEKQRENLGRTDILGQPAVRINGEVITRETLARECLEQYGTSVLDDVISRTIIQQACQKKGIQITDAQVMAEVNRISKRAGMPTDQWYKFQQSQSGMTPLQYRRNAIWPLLALRQLAGQEVEVTREMLTEAYVDNYGPRVKAKMIMLNNPRHATNIADRLKTNPEAFEDIASESSIDQSSRALGGSIPPIRRHSGAPEGVRDAAFRMSTEGEISPVIQTGARSYVILKFEGRTEPVEHDPADVQAQLHEELVEREVQTLVAETFSELKKAARVDNYLTGETSSPIRQTSATSEDLTAFELQEAVVE